MKFFHHSTGSFLTKKSPNNIDFRLWGKQWFSRQIKLFFCVSVHCDIVARIINRWFASWLLSESRKIHARNSLKHNFPLTLYPTSYLFLNIKLRYILGNGPTIASNIFIYITSGLFYFWYVIVFTFDYYNLNQYKNPPVFFLKSWKNVHQLNDVCSIYYASQIPQVVK